MRSKEEDQNEYEVMRKTELLLKIEDLYDDEIIEDC
jgi:hypothetical protein